MLLDALRFSISQSAFNTRINSILLSADSSRTRPSIFYLALRDVTPLRMDSSGAAAEDTKRKMGRRGLDRIPSPLETRISLALALASQSFSLSQRVILNLTTETAKYVFPKRFETRSLEEALMSVPDLETVKFKTLRREDGYEIRQVEPYFVAETKMRGKSGFDFYGASQAFNVLAAYLFGKNVSNESMEMTTPVYTQMVRTDGEKMEMTTPVITKQSGDLGEWQMSFVMPSKHGAKLPLPKDPSVRIRKVPGKTVAVVAFSGYVSDVEVERREAKLREAMRRDAHFQVKENATVEVAQYNPPFTLPFTRRNEISLEVEPKNIQSSY